MDMDTRKYMNPWLYINQTIWITKCANDILYEYINIIVLSDSPFFRKELYINIVIDIIININFFKNIIMQFFIVLFTIQLK
jgi:hypothetical protein